jgi:hypothetical protein
MMGKEIFSFGEEGKIQNLAQTLTWSDLEVIYIDEIHCSIQFSQKIKN